ncbi:hypothetical protein Pla175_30560 [Pirellulimonas nuda]|uniref:Uncharacterized protein n=1 Tax=Pirellulimonas nuda TaxID=2528009 RepID=A0A518DE08_9BACT|nr:hypothetical protein Pla175_30560 [Pirellulimonas nuda]
MDEWVRKAKKLLTVRRFSMQSTTKRIAVPIDLQYAYPWHHETYQGIRQYADESG